MGTVCPGGQEGGDQKSGEQMCLGPNKSQPHGGQGQKLLSEHQRNGDGENSAFPWKSWLFLNSHVWQPGLTHVWQPGLTQSKHGKRHVSFTCENPFVTKRMAEDTPDRNRIQTKLSRH